ncbi:MAG: hypothetical protein ACK5LY_03175 [Lachnospirales bacterium]
MSYEKNLEIEKKYLINVKSLPFSLENLEKQEIEQYYISKKPTIRIRKSNETYILTIKTKNSSDIIEAKVNKELETLINKEEYTNLLNLVKTLNSKPIIKNRYIFDLGNGYIAEIDEFLGDFKGIYIVEVEFKDNNTIAEFEKPKWFGKDVSLEKIFVNAYMSAVENAQEIIAYYFNNI